MSISLFRRPFAQILLMGGVLELIWLSTCALGPLRKHTEPFIALMLAAFILCLWSFLRLPILTQRSAAMVVAIGLLFRLTVLPAPPYQSEDVYRYLWDAKMSSIGVGPYRYAPSAPELESERDSQLYPMINSKPYITTYPPLSQILFRLSYELFGSRVTPMKGVFAALEFLSLLLAWRLLNLLGRPLKSLYLMAWNPFFIFEFSHSGHSDSAMMLCILLSIYFLHQRKNSWAMASYAGAVLAKLHPALWLPLHLRRAGWKASLAGGATGAVLLIAYFNPASGLRYLSGLRYYFQLFEFNAGIHYLLRYIGRAVYDQSWDKATGPYLAGVLIVAAIMICWKFRLHSNLDLLHAGFWIMTADLCLATTVHPWYISWAALALPFFPYAFMVYWTGSCFLSYMAYASHPVFEPSWVLWIEYLPMYCLMGWEIYRGGPLLARLCDKEGEREKIRPDSAA